MPVSPNYMPAPRYLELGEGFADPVNAARFPTLKLRFRNQRWAEKLGLGELSDEEWQKHFALFEPLPQNLPQPLALRYHGHQFRSYNPQLGDGRGFLFAQLEFRGRLLDLATKGSGQTPYSRGGDGRLTLKGAVREVLATEMLEALGVPTSKTFSVFETGDSLERNDEPSPTRAAVLVRLGHSHVRFGTFQRLAAFGDVERMKRLQEFCSRVYFHIEQQSVVEFYREVVLRSAELAGHWMIAGFVHGVLNTDNMNICGESFDYGPYRFLPEYDPNFTAAYFDHSGLYAFGRQPESVYWNLQQLGASLSALVESEKLQPVLEEYADRFNETCVDLFLRRLGIEGRGVELDLELLTRTMEFLATKAMGYAEFFFHWYGLNNARIQKASTGLSGESFARFQAALAGYQPTQAAPRNLQLSYFQSPKPCDLLRDEIELIWDAISDREDWSLFKSKIASIRAMGVALGTASI